MGIVLITVIVSLARRPELPGQDEEPSRVEMDFLNEDCAPELAGASTGGL
jgi:hypothetical protein